MTSRLVPIAEIARPHGVLGELRLKLYNEDTDLIAKGRRVHLVPASKPLAGSGKAQGKTGPSKIAPSKTAPSKTAPSEAGTDSDRSLPKTILTVRPTSGALLIRLDGVEGRDAAEAIRGMQLCVDRAELPDLPDGEFYACDVEGARVELVSGESVGIVTEFRTYPTCSVLVVARAEVGAREIEVPLVDDYVAAVDTDAKLVKLFHIDEL